MTNINSLLDLAKSATKTTFEEFNELIKNVTIQLANEDRVIGNLKITGRLVTIPASGKIIIIGDLHGDLQSLLFILRKTKFLSKVKCFSIIFAPFATAPIDASIPNEWSEKPIIKSGNVLLYVSITFRFNSSKCAG